MPDWSAQSDGTYVVTAKVTDTAASRLVPARTTDVPPATGPLDGVTVLPNAQKAPTHERFAKWVAQLDELERRLIPGLHDRIVTKFHYAPSDFATDLNAHMGIAFSLEPVLTQSAYFRGHNRDDVLDNFYLVGAGTRPGAGIPGVVGSAKATAGLMLEDLA